MRIRIVKGFGGVVEHVELAAMKFSLARETIRSPGSNDTDSTSASAPALSRS
jgi:hypothetical protein